MANAVSGFVDSVIGFFTDLKSNVVQTVTNLGLDVVRFFREMTTKATAAVSAWLVQVQAKFTEIRTAAVDRIRSMVTDIIRFFTELPGRARAALSSLGTNIVSAASSAASMFSQRISRLVTDAIATIRELPGRARAALGNLGSVLVSAGQDLIRGMINGVKAMAQSLIGAARGVVKGAVDAAKSLLGISSPSKVFFEIGEFTGQGLVNGFEAMAARVRATARDMAGILATTFQAAGPAAFGQSAAVRAVSAIADPFGTGNTSAASQAVRRAPVASVTNNFVINEVGDADATARRVINRMALAASL